MVELLLKMQPPSGELPVHHPARWSPLPSSSLQSIPMAMPVLQKAEAAAALPLEYNSNINNNVQQASADPSTTSKKVTATTAVHSSSSTAAVVAESSRTFAVVVEANHPQLLPAELGLESLSTSSCVPQTETSGSGDNVRNIHHTAYNSHQQQHEYGSGVYSNYEGGPRVGSSQKNSVSSDWSSHHHHHRRRGAGFQGRNNHHTFGGVEKSFSPSKVKQIYVAKQSSTRNSS